MLEAWACKPPGYRGAGPEVSPPPKGAGYGLGQQPSPVSRARGCSARGRPGTESLGLCPVLCPMKKAAGEGLAGCVLYRSLSAAGDAQNRLCQQADGLGRRRRERARLGHREDPPRRPRVFAPRPDRHREDHPSNRSWVSSNGTSMTCPTRIVTSGKWGVIGPAGNAPRRTAAQAADAELCTGVGAMG